MRGRVTAREEMCGGFRRLRVVPRRRRRRRSISRRRRSRLPGLPSSSTLLSSSVDDPLARRDTRPSRPMPPSVDPETFPCEDTGSGPVLVAIHGWSLSGRWLLDALPAAVLAGRRALAPDLRGHGRSPEGGSFTLDELARDLVAALDAALGRARRGPRLVARRAGRARRDAAPPRPGGGARARVCHRAFHRRRKLAARPARAHARGARSPGRA